MSSNINKELLKVSSKERARMKNQNAVVIWFTGLSGSGKSTLAIELDKKLSELGYHSYVLDGDNIRSGINNNLSFSPEDRSENIRRIAEISKLFIDAGIITICSFISPYKTDREKAKEIIGSDNFIEIYLNTPLKECEKRDVKGLYKKARNGEIKNFTGISAPYEKPINPDLSLDTTFIDINSSIEKIIALIKKSISLEP